MAKKNIISKFASWLVYHPWLKLIALLLAVILWLYAKGEMSNF